MFTSSRVPSATQTDVTGLSWFKIWEDGFDGKNWGVTRLVAAHGNQTFKIPECLAPGNYLLRAEISELSAFETVEIDGVCTNPSALVALHGASTYPGAQFYVGSDTSVLVENHVDIQYRRWSALKSMSPGVALSIHLAFLSQ